jgi:pimeloyl-ACP methyl ester carboxylesterase
MAHVLNYEENGDGYPVVLIHGFCENKKIWEAFAALLSVSYRVITLDLPGFGDSKIKEEPLNWDIDYFAQSVHATLKHAGIEKPILIGHSLGGYVSLAYADLYPRQFIGLGLFHSTAFADSEEKKANRLKSIEFVKTYGTAQFVSSLFPNLFALKNREAIRPQINYLVNEGAKTPIETVVNTLMAMRNRPDRIHVLQNLRVPVLYIIGQEDQAVPYTQSLQEIGLAQDTTARIFSHIGHMGMVEAREETLQALQHFAAYCIQQHK